MYILKCVFPVFRTTENRLGVSGSYVGLHCVNTYPPADLKSITFTVAGQSADYVNAGVISFKNAFQIHTDLCIHII